MVKSPRAVITKYCNLFSHSSPQFRSQKSKIKVLAELGFFQKLWGKILPCLLSFWWLSEILGIP